eukprot:TRINITY_DN65465_c0_g2_i1.p2 TRINITY_DN65465_c0_g2~~TRINITY_DN65465_c0_g2_i1.p2  ORF type:complete len:109 (+),score=6.13 TRINITY_DN65465_c0_g2_i1:187-513(+)
MSRSPSDLVAVRTGRQYRGHASALNSTRTMDVPVACGDGHVALFVSDALAAVVHALPPALLSLRLRRVALVPPPVCRVGKRHTSAGTHTPAWAHRFFQCSRSSDRPTD